MTTLALALGGDLSRSDIRCRLTKPGSHVDLLGLYIADGAQHFDHETLQAAGPDAFLREQRDVLRVIERSHASDRVLLTSFHDGVTRAIRANGGEAYVVRHRVEVLDRAGRPRDAAPREERVRGEAADDAAQEAPQGDDEDGRDAPEGSTAHSLKTVMSDK